MSEDIEQPVRVTIHKFDVNAVHRVSKALDLCVATDQKFLPITIMSPGGGVYALFAIIDLIQHGPVPCATIAVGMAASAGAVLLASGHPGLRFVGPNASVLVHEMIASTPSQSIEDAKEDIVVATSLNERMLAHLDKSCKKPKGFWKKKLRASPHRDLNLSADEAVKLGLADHVGLPVIQLETQAAVTLTMPDPPKKRGKK